MVFVKNFANFAAKHLYWSLFLIKSKSISLGTSFEENLRTSVSNQYLTVKLITKLIMVVFMEFFTVKNNELKNFAIVYLKDGFTGTIFCK